MLWFALHLHRLPLEAWTSTLPPEPAGQARPRCVAEARRVVLADAAAQALGVAPGISVASAAALAAGLEVLTRDVRREAQLVERLAGTLARFTPSLVLQPDGVLLEVDASRRLFGGARALWRAVREAVRDSGIEAVQMAVAPTASAAALLARVPAAPAPRGTRALRAASRRSDAPASAGLPVLPGLPGLPEPTAQRLPLAEATRLRLDALPLPEVLAAWALPTTVHTLLQGIGCRTLADVRRLPARGLHRRGAAPLLERLARADGEAPDPQLLHEWPERFELGLELLQRADDAAMLVFATQRLVQPLGGWLACRWSAAAALTLVLRHERSLRHPCPDTLVVLKLAEPTREPAQIGLLLRERLQRLVLPAPVYALRLRLDQAVPHAGHEALLWPERGGAGGEGERALLDRLVARLGPEQVLRARLHADHRPERAFQWCPVELEAAAARPGAAVRHAARAPHPARAADGAAPADAPRPAWLLETPQRLTESARGGRLLHQGVPLVLAGRAERIESGWFDGQPIARDYHLARTPDHRWLWVYRERMGERAGERTRDGAGEHAGQGDARWFLHGLFG